MTINYINTGTSPNKGDGDTLRTAFSKINANFGFLSTATGALPTALYNGTWTFALTSTGTVTLNGEPFVSGGTSIGVIQSATAPIGNTGTVWYDTVGGRSYVYYDGAWVDANPAIEPSTATDLSAVAQDIIPALDKQYNLGSPSHQWKSLYVSTNTIYIGGIPLSVDTATNTLLVAGSQVTGSGSATTSTLVNNGLSISFNSAGHLVFPAGSEHYDLGAGDSILAHAFSVNGNEWSFDSTGGTTLPGDLNFTYGGAIFEGGNGLPGRSWQTGLNIVGAVDNGTYTPIRIYAHGGDGKGFHMGAINVKNDRVEIYGDLVNDSVGTFWTFKNDGSLAVPNHLHVPVAGGAHDRIKLYDFADNAKINYAIGTEANYIWTSVDATTAGFKWYAGTGVALTLLGDGTLTLSNGVKLDIGTANKFAIDQSTTNYIDLRDGSGRGFYTDTSGYTLRSNSGYSWIYDPNGILNLPNSITGSALIQSTSSIKINPDGFTTTFGSDGKVTIPGEIRSIAGVGDVVIESNNGTTHTWTFGGNGNITFPDTTVQTTAWNDAAFMASMASYDGAVAFNTATVGVGGLVVNGPVQFNGPFTFEGTATVINSNSGTFYGDVNGVGALYAGVAGSTQLPATVFQSAADVNDYIQNNFQNLNHGTQASTEWVATNDTGNDSNNYIDMGIAGHGWDGTQANSVGTAAGPSDSWVYTQGTVSSSEGGNLILGTIKDGKAVKILAGSNGASSVVAQFDAGGMTLTTGTGITFADGTHQATAISSSGTVVLSTLNVTNLSATNITINGQSISAGVTKITAGTGTHVSTTTGALTLWVDSFNTGTLVAQAVTALSIPYANVTGTPNLSGYALSSQVSTLQITVNNLTNTVSTLTTTATVQSLIANSLTNYATQSYITSQGYLTSSTVNQYVTSGISTASVAALIANSLTNYATQSFVTGQGYATTATVNSLIANSLTNYTTTASVNALIVNSLTNYATQSYVTTRGYLTTVTSVAYATTSSSAQVVTSAAQPTITSVGTLTSLSVAGNVTANKYYGDGSSLTNITVTQQANIVGVQQNVTLVAGSYSYLFDNTGTFTMPTNGDIVVPGATANISVGNTVYAATTGTTGGYAFVAGPGASSQAALLLQGAPGVAANMAIRDNSTVSSSIYYDVSIGGTNNGTHQFRGTSSYTQYAQIDRYGINLPTRPAFRVYGAGTTNNLSTTQNTNGILNGNNFAVDYNQGTALSTSTGVFTAPVAGLYSIHLVARITSNSAGQAQVTVIKNNGLGSQANQVMWETGPNPSINHFGASTISKLAAGDTLVLKVALGTINFDANDSWSVAYIG